MVSPLLRSALREIRQSLGRYLAILAIVALGVGFFAGLRMAEPNMKLTGADYVDGRALHDYRLLSTLGFTEEDVAYFAGQGSIHAARGAVYSEFLSRRGNEDAVLLAHSLTDGVNTPHLLAGRLPRSGNECLGDANYFTEDDIGGAITVSGHNDADTRELLRHDSYTIVGLANSPLYLNAERGTASIGNGAVAAFVLIPEEGFDFEAYHEIYLHMEGVGAPYSAAYDDFIDGYQPALEDQAQARGRLRYETLRQDALAELAEGEQELQDGWEEYNDGLREWEDGKQEYADGLQEYEDGLEELQDGEAKLAAGWREYRDGKEKAEAEFAAAEKTLNDGEAAYAQGKADLEAGKTRLEQLTGLYQLGNGLLLQVKQQNESYAFSSVSEMLTAAQADPALSATLEGVLTAIRAQAPETPALAVFSENWAAAEAALAPAPFTQAPLDAMQATLTGAETTLTQSRAELDAGWAQYNTTKADVEKQLDDALSQLRAGSRKLAEGRQELQDAKVELDDAARDIAEGEEELADAYQELLDGEAELQDGYAELDDLKEPDVFVLTRQENATYASFDSDTNIIKAIAVAFPAFFYLVAALVCMTTMKRMVDEQRTQIGVLKALGYSNGQVLGKYVLYAGSAAVAGYIVGYIAGTLLLPWVIWELYGMQYGFAELQYTFDPGLALLSFAAAMASSVGVTIVACRAELRHQSAELLRPKAPKAGKRVFLEHIPPLWKRLSFLQKVSIRNVLRYKSRLVMILLGIGGCTALLITGFGIQDSVADIGHIQYEEITLYDYQLSFREEKTPREAADYITARGWAAEDGLLLYTGAADVIGPGGIKSATLTVSATGTVEPFVSLHDESGPLAYPGAGQAVLTRGLAESLGLAVGDTVELRDDDLHSGRFTVSGVCDNYLGYAVYLSPAAYETMTGQAPGYKTMYLNATAGADVYAESVKLTDKDAVASVQLSLSSRNAMTQMLSRMSYVVVVVVVFAAALAFVVLYNLTNINISERVREIATIKVLGFTRRETAAYIFREIYMLSALGSLVGVGLGKALHAYVMAQVKVDGVYFPSRVAPESYLISVALTLLFTVAICLFLRRKLHTVHMAESLKSIE